MAEDKRLETLQEEIKLMKGELKQSLASVRDYLLNMELPSSEISTILSALSEGDQKISLSGNLGTFLGAKPPEDEITETEEEQAVPDESEEVPEGDDLLDLEKPDEDEAGTGPEDSLAEEDGGIPEEEITPAMEDELPGLEEADENEPDEPPLSGPEMSGDEEEPVPEDKSMLEDEPMPEDEPMQEEEPMQYDKTIDEATLSVPKVNMLVNLINWVATANKEIGRDQLPIFLEVYGISGHLSPELKEVILHLSEITENEPDITGSTAIWSQSMLLLHGILTGGDAPLHPVIPVLSAEEKPSADEEIIEVDKSKDRPVRLKLVLPDEDGTEKEFCIDLTPQADSGAER
jgi:hypothetical protein